MKREKIKIIVAYLMVLLWLIVIFSFSNADSNTSNNKSKDTIDKVITVVDDSVVNVGIKDKPLSSEEKSEIVNNLNFPLRKLMHFTEYLILSLLLVNALSLSKVKHKYLVSILLCIIYASSDEFHQTFISGRTGQLIDVLIDSLGIIVGSIIYYYGSKLINKKKKLN